MVSSTALADIAADAIGIARASAQLHLKIIRADGQITFKGHGSSAASMTSLDASRLVIAIMGSTFAKDSVGVLERFAGLKPVRHDGTKETLEECLAKRIDELPMDDPSEDLLRRRSEPGRSFGSRRSLDLALQLFDPIGSQADVLPSFAVVRWITSSAYTHVRLFGASTSTREEPAREVKTDIADLVERYTAHRFFQVRVLRRDALIDVAKGLKGIGNKQGNFGNR